MPAPINVARCAMEPLYQRGRFQATYHDLTEQLGARVIGATVFETAAGYTRGPYHFHDGVEEWMYVVTGEPVLRDPGGERALAPGSLVAFPAGPDGAHTVNGPGRIVMFSVGARGWGEAFTSVYPDADKVGAKPGVQFLRSAALHTWAEPAVEPVAGAPSGPCPTVDLRSCSPDSPRRLGTRTWLPTLHALAPGETSGAYRYDFCREHWALVIAGAPTLRHADGQDVLAVDDIVCLAEGEAGAHQFRNDGDEPARLLLCSTPVGAPWAAVYPDDGTYELRVPGQRGYRFRLADRLEDYWDGEPGAGGV